MKKTQRYLVIIVAFFAFVNCAVYGQSTETKSTFALSSANQKTIVCVDKNEKTVVNKSIALFGSDVSDIAGRSIAVQNKLPENGNVVVVGTLGTSKIIDPLILKYKLNTDSLRGKWEAFCIQILPRKNGKILLVLGSDRRGTAYGVLELSRMMGISPWIWWADVKPTRKAEILLNVPSPIFQKPSVQYRGIFLNDEDWGLKPWASKTIEPEIGEIGPKTYRKIFELLLRLRANTIWPAMHECSMPFYFVKGNAAMADSFGIVVSTSHCEPMMRSNPREWNHETNGNYNFFTNKDKVVNYWTERLSEVSKFENVYTVGIRGIHDGAMEGAKTVQQQVAGLTDVFGVQQQLLSKYVTENAEEVPQIFIPYKEVLDAYNAGLKVPENVTLVWCDDNYGYLTRLSNAEEQKRKGGSGVYYHLSYWGRPHDYLWLATMQPSFIWTEMQKAWAYGARKMWILNVGDIKPAEYLTEFYMDMAWNINAVKQDNVSAHLENWMGKTFGKSNAESLKNIMNEYYRLAFIRRPEFMGWSQTEPTTKVKTSDLNPQEFGDEIATRLNQYQAIENKVFKLEKEIPANLKNAYFELVKYPVAGAAEMNKKWLNWQYANFYGANQPEKAEAAKKKSLEAYDKIQKMTAFFNDSIENGKWKWMMSSKPRKLPVFDQPVFASFAADSSAAKKDFPPSNVRRKDRYMRFKASEFVRNNAKASAQWKSVEGLGYSRSAMLLQPFGAKLSESVTENPSLEYEFYAQMDSVNIFIYLLPTHPVDASNNMRIAVSVDNEAPKLYNINTVGRSVAWKEGVLRNQIAVKIPYEFKTAGTHVIHIYAVDADMVFDQLLIDSWMNRKFYGVGE